MAKLLTPMLKTLKAWILRRRGVSPAGRGLRFRCVYPARLVGICAWSEDLQPQTFPIGSADVYESASGSDGTWTPCRRDDEGRAIVPAGRWIYVVATDGDDLNMWFSDAKERVE